MGKPKEVSSPRVGCRRLLAGGALATASLPLLHEVVPHQGLHSALSGEAAASGTQSGHMDHATVPATGRAGHGAPGAPLHMLLGLIAGGPAILGAWIGGAAFNNSIVALLLDVGVGGILSGIGVLYLTGLLISV